jgi:hypothetical protein
VGISNKIAMWHFQVIKLKQMETNIGQDTKNPNIRKLGTIEENISVRFSSLINIENIVIYFFL